MYQIGFFLLFVLDVLILKHFEQQKEGIPFALLALLSIICFLNFIPKPINKKRK